jgi:hypothetical protein
MVFTRHRRHRSSSQPRICATAAGLAAGSLLLLSGCGDIFGNKDPHQPGNDLGMFRATASLLQSSCGSGALGSPSSWQFDVKLSRGDRVLFWHNGAEVISGSLAEDGVTFAFDAGIVMDMRTEEDLGWPPCSVARRDHAEGTLAAAEADTSVDSFSAQLSYEFKPTQDSECADLVTGETPVFAALPCAIIYQVSAVRTDAPAN